MSDLDAAILSLRTAALERMLSLRGIVTSKEEVHALTYYKTDAQIIEELKSRRDKSGWLRLWFRN